MADDKVKRQAYVLGIANGLADAAFMDEQVVDVLCANELSVQDVTLAFRKRLESRLKQKRILDQAPACAKCGRRPEDPIHLAPPGLGMRSSVSDKGAEAHRYVSSKGRA